MIFHSDTGDGLIDRSKVSRKERENERRERERERKARIWKIVHVTF